MPQKSGKFCSSFQLMHALPGLQIMCFGWFLNTKSKPWDLLLILLGNSFKADFWKSVDFHEPFKYICQWRILQLYCKTMHHTSFSFFKRLYLTSKIQHTQDGKVLFNLYVRWWNGSKRNSDFSSLHMGKPPACVELITRTSINWFKIWKLLNIHITNTGARSQVNRLQQTFGTVHKNPPLLDIYRARARNRYSSLYRGENFLCSGAENPPLDLPHTGVEPIFFSIKRKFSAVGCGESTFGSTTPGRRTDFLLYIEEKIFCARARRIHLWIYCWLIDLLIISFNLKSAVLH